MDQPIKPPPTDKVPTTLLILELPEAELDKSHQALMASLTLIHTELETLPHTELPDLHHMELLELPLPMELLVESLEPNTVQPAELHTDKEHQPLEELVLPAQSLDHHQFLDHHSVLPPSPVLLTPPQPLTKENLS